MELYLLSVLNLHKHAKSTPCRTHVVTSLSGITKEFKMEFTGELVTKDVVVSNLASTGHFFYLGRPCENTRQSVVASNEGIGRPTRKGVYISRRVGIFSLTSEGIPEPRFTFYNEVLTRQDQTHTLWMFGNENIDC